MKLLNTRIKDTLLIEPRVFTDNRGYFFERYQKEKLETLGVTDNFVQDNVSRSSRGVLRGLHFQWTRQQAKLVSVNQGEVLDVALDLRVNSPTFGQYEAAVLSDKNKLMFYIPKGFAHGFAVLSDVAEFQYKCSDYYAPNDEGGIIWNDPEIDINWPIDDPIVSEKDQMLPRLFQIESKIKELQIE